MKANHFLVQPLAGGKEVVFPAPYILSPKAKRLLAGDPAFQAIVDETSDAASEFKVILESAAWCILCAQVARAALDLPKQIDAAECEAFACRYVYDIEPSEISDGTVEENFTVMSGENF
ncbi:hypothetical protein K6V98_00165 [Collinsella sp. AGMB00827]|uniref:Uncharacterized protein n=1 Tax=Collinsella ureilytica TaxID=2869515 RepID=A0ABS7MHF0_9ACTN|nr:hypothetical protein [Collinsella urealyticum]MBY4796784.1 hypothetical protein [Collinsella urealyticum]